MEGCDANYRDKEDGQGKRYQRQKKKFSLEHIKYKLYIKDQNVGAELSWLSLVV